jgi:oligopeptide/dipeptide ABC transporter ATP-binding protein
MMTAEAQAPGKLQAKATPILSVRKLRTSFVTPLGDIAAVNGVDLDVFPGECLAVVGESGSGKSLTFQSIMGLVKPPGHVEAEAMEFAGDNLLRMSFEERQTLRGSRIAMTMQDALTALNPALTVKTQIIEVLLAHGKAAGRKDALEQALSLLRLVGIAAPESRLESYPHELSGGMRQRVMVAIALACRPALLIADEPTTALDVTIQAQVLDVIARLRRELHMSVVLITHDLGVVAGYADRIAVMYAGEVVEIGPVAKIIAEPRHPYTAGLLNSIPRLDRLGAKLMPIPGQVPAPWEKLPGCRFAPRCPHVREECTIGPIPMFPAGQDRQARCVLEAPC